MWKRDIPQTAIYLLLAEVFLLPYSMRRRSNILNNQKYYPNFIYCNITSTLCKIIIITGNKSDIRS